MSTQPKFASQLRAGEIKLGVSISYPCPGIIERLGRDWDWVWIDGQHGQLGYQDVLAVVRACDAMQRAAFVRIPWQEAGSIALALDAGATGIIVPCVDTVEEAQAVVAIAKFPPLGRRSFGGRRVIDMVGRGYAETANQDTVLIVQIESPIALENAAAIAAIPGVDGLFLGPDDVLLRRGHSMTAPRPKDGLRGEYETVIKACRTHNKIPVAVAIGAENFSFCLSLGYTLLAAGGDAMFLSAGSKSASDEARQLIAGKAPKPSGDAAGKAGSPY